MKMELIQPFINAADAVLSQGLQSPMAIGNLSMEEEAYRRKGVAAMANQIIGNAVACLNDQGFHFRVHPPELHTSDQGPRSTADTEALVLCFETSRGSVFMNIALRYHASMDHIAAGRGA